jgi:hypothetical protein
MMTPWCTPDDFIDLLCKRSRVNVTRIKPTEPPFIVEGLDHIIRPINALPVFPVVLPWLDDIIHPIESSLGIAVTAHLYNFFSYWID